MRSPTPRAIALLAISLSLAACGSSSSNSTSAASAVNSKYTAALAFASCMRTHGVPSFPDPKTSGNGGLLIQASNGNTAVNGVAVNGPAFRSAMQACHSKLPNGGHPQPLSASQRNAALKFSACMRSHGLTNFPDPTFSGPGVRLGLSKSSGIDPSSPAFQAAQKACGSVIGKAG
jgi:hypothetical protein